MKTRAVVAWIAGILLVASSCAHAFLGLPPLRASLKQIGADADLMETATIGWLFGSVAMLAFGLIVLWVALRLSRRMEVSRGPALVIGACYLAFGAAAFVWSGRNPHFLAFMVIGALVATSVLGRKAGIQPRA